MKRMRINKDLTIIITMLYIKTIEGAENLKRGKYDNIISSYVFQPQT